MASRKRRLWDDGHKTALAEATRQLQVSAPIWEMLPDYKNLTPEDLKEQITKSH